jgi:hypothetical protein
LLVTNDVAQSQSVTQLTGQRGWVDLLLLVLPNRRCIRSCSRVSCLRVGNS